MYRIYTLVAFERALFPQVYTHSSVVCFGDAGTIDDNTLFKNIMGLIVEGGRAFRSADGTYSYQLGGFSRYVGLLLRDREVSIFLCAD